MVDLVPGPGVLVHAAVAAGVLDERQDIAGGRRREDLKLDWSDAAGPVLVAGQEQIAGGARGTAVRRAVRRGLGQSGFARPCAAADDARLEVRRRAVDRADLRPDFPRMAARVG